MARPDIELLSRPTGSARLGRFVPGELAQDRQRLYDRRAAHLRAADVAILLLPVDQPPTARRAGEMHEPDRLAGRRAARPGDAGDRDREIDRRAGDGTLGHRFGGFAAHRAMIFERRRSDAEHRLFGFIAVGHEAALEHVGGAGDLGDDRGDEPAGAGFRGGYFEPLLAAEIEQRLRLVDQLLVHIQSLHGSRTVAFANAAMPSPRPVKPIFSLVVAFTPTRSSGTPAIWAMRARMASRCGPTRGASQTTVTSRWAMRPPRARRRSTAKAKNRSDEAPRHCGSLGGKCTPMSPSASAPRIASTRAWRTTSASECPDNPR